MKMTKVFLCGGDRLGWALDDDLDQVSRALEGLVEFSALNQCDVVHTVWWNELLGLPQEKLKGKKVVCHLSGEPYRYLSLPAFIAARPAVGIWIAQSTQAKTQLASLGMRNALIPYAVDERIFRPLQRSDAFRREWLEKFGLPDGRYLIGNFHRDTEGSDLRSPKLVKGPDVFLAMVAELHRQGLPIHVVLAGPRRHWLRRRLTEAGVPFTYVGREVGGDDVESNRLPREMLNLLYNLLDLYAVSSRSEGGPRSVLEAAAAQCRIISTSVGIAPDILEPECLYSNVLEGVELVRKDIERSALAKTVQPQYRRIVERHTPLATRELFARIYESLDSVPQRQVSGPVRSAARTGKSLLARVRQLLPGSAHVGFTVCLWHRFFKPPYGGGNQFMLALRKALRAKRVKVLENQISPWVDAYVLNSVQFDVDRFLEVQSRRNIKVLHRIDGPIQLIRGFDQEKDDLCFELNRKFASATIFQSDWTLRQCLALGYKPVNPVIVRNAIDPDIFHSRDRIPFDLGRKIRLISSCWSDNPRKGGPVYKWIEEHLDWDRFEYTFVGRASEEFARIRQVDPVASVELAQILRQHDIYITASQNDPCSNAVIEALACGLPVLYYNHGGHPELVGHGGLPFNDTSEILSQLGNLVDNYDTFQSLIVVSSMEDVAARYLEVLQRIARDD